MHVANSSINQKVHLDLALDETPESVAIPERPLSYGKVTYIQSKLNVMFTGLSNLKFT